MPGAAEVTITCSGSVRTSDRAGIVGQHVGNLPLWALLGQTPLTRPGARMRALAGGFAGDDDPVGMLHRLSQAILGEVRYETGRTQADTAAEEAMAAGYARSQEFAAESSLKDALAEFDDASGRVLRAAAEVDPALAVPVPDLPWFPKDVDHWSVRWVWLHLIEELARHAGHADIIRETIDGATMYELVAAHDGVDPGFLQPWRPTEPPVTRGFTTVTLVADDVAAAGAWYADALDAPLTFESPDYVELELGPHAHQLGILDRTHAGAVWEAAERGDPGGVTSYLWVTDVEAALERLTQRGATPHQPSREFGGGYVGASVVDPFGNVLGVMSRPWPQGGGPHAD